MVEESPETFVARWRPFAARAHLFSRSEGSPLLEIRLAGAVLQVFERTGPYLAPPGPARVIVNPSAERIERADPGAEGDGRRIEPLGISRARVHGTVLEREGEMLVVDAGAPLVVVSLEELPDDIAGGDAVRFETIAPIHGFVLPPDPRRDGALSTDDLV